MDGGTLAGSPWNARLKVHTLFGFHGITLGSRAGVGSPWFMGGFGSLGFMVYRPCRGDRLH